MRILLFVEFLKTCISYSLLLIDQSHPEKPFASPLKIHHFSHGHSVLLLNYF